MTEFNFILNFLDLVFLQGDLLGIRGEGPLGSADPMVKGMLPSALGIIGFSIMLNPVSYTHLTLPTNREV